MATQNINNYNSKKFRVRLKTNEYFDLTLASDEQDFDTEVLFSVDVIGANDGNRLPIRLDLSNTGTTLQPNLYWDVANSANTLTSLNYYNPNNEDLSCYTGFTGLCDAGLTMIDNGVLPKMTGESIYYSMGVFPDKTHDPLYHDRRMKFHPIINYNKRPNHPFSAKTKNTVYNIVDKSDINIGYYQELYGGFYQGFYKLFGYDYEVFPERVNKGWTMETLIKPRQVSQYTLRDDEQYLNDVYPDNAGTFFFFGTRAEDKFYHPASGYVDTVGVFPCDFGFDITGSNVEEYEYQRITSGLTNCFTTCGCADTGNTTSQCQKIYPVTGKTVNQVNGLCSRGYDVQWTGDSKDSRLDILSNAMSLRLSGDPKNPRLCVKYIRYTGGCETTGTCENTGTTYTSGYCINEVCSTRGIYDICGFPVDEAEHTKEQWVMLSAVFERYTYIDGCDLLNLGGLGDIRKEVYSAETYGVTTNLIQPPQTHPGDVHDSPYIQTKFTEKWLNQVDFRRGLLKLYVNGYLFMILEDFEEIIPHELQTQKEKQIGVPFTISWGGGTQGLRESLIPSGCTSFEGPYIQDPELMPNEVLSGSSLSGLTTNIEMEPAFGGTFMGGVSQFRMYAEPLTSPQIQHNFRVEKDKYCLFDYWCPNCLEILSQCYFEFNVDDVVCDFDFIINDINCEFGINIIETSCALDFNINAVSCAVDVNITEASCSVDFNVTDTTCSLDANITDVSCDMGSNIL